MRYKIKVALIFLFVTTCGYSQQSHIERYNKCIRDAEDCYNQKELKCAHSNYKTAQKIAREFNLNSQEADRGMERVRNAENNGTNDLDDEHKTIQVQQKTESGKTYIPNSCEQLISEADKLMNLPKPNYEKVLNNYALARANCRERYFAMLDAKIKKVKGLLKKNEEKKNNLFKNLTHQSETTGKNSQIDLSPNNLTNNSPRSPENIESPNKQLVFQEAYEPTRSEVNKENIFHNIDRLMIYLTSKRFRTESNSEEEIIEAMQMRLYGPDYITEDKWLYDSTLVAINKSQITEHLICLHVLSATFYSWNLLDEHKWKPTNPDSIKQILQNSIDIIAQNSSSSSLITYAISCFENLLSKYYKDIDDIVNSYKHQLISLEYARKSVASNPLNVYYLRNFFISLRNMKYIPDSIFSENEKARCIEIEYKLVGHIKNNIDTGLIAVNVYEECIEDSVANLESVEAIKVIQEALSFIQKHKIDYRYSEYGPLLQTILYNRICYNYYDLGDLINYKLSAQKAQNCFLRAINSQMTTQRMLIKLQSAFNGIITHLNIAFNDSEKLSFYKSVIHEIEIGRNDFLSIKNISYVRTKSAILLGEMLLEQQTSDDTLHALIHLSASLSAFEEINYLDSYSSYSEDYAMFCQMYCNIVKLYISQNNYFMAKKNYMSLMNVFMPVIKEYRFDYYLIQTIAAASDVYGDYLFKQNRYSEALQPLKLASFEGIKRSTENLAEIYSEGLYVQRDSHLADSLNNLAQKQSLKIFTIQCDFGRINKESFDFYVREVSRDYPYKGIEDQVEWLLEARGGKVPDNVRNSFIKLQEIAWENDVSFPDLCSYAMDLANNERILEKYRPVKEKIETETDSIKKEALYNDLFSIYENDIMNVDSGSRKIITEDAVVTYNKYAALLIDNNKNEKAKDVYHRVFQLDNYNTEAESGLARINYLENKKNLKKLLKTNNIISLESYLDSYLEDKDSSNAWKVTQTILKLQDIASTRDEISNIYLSRTGKNEFLSLFLSDTSKTGTYLAYFLSKKTGDFESDDLRRTYYNNLVLLDEELLRQHPNDSLIKLLSSHYNSFGWYCLLTKHFENVILYFEKSRSLDSTNLFPLTNLPHAYLFNNKFEEAKKLYLFLKDKEFDRSAGYPTFKDAFLNDFKDFEEAGIANDYIFEIKNLLSAPEN